MSEAFYQPVDVDRYRSQEHTRGPWSPDHQHAGPPGRESHGDERGVTERGLQSLLTTPT